MADWASIRAFGGSPLGECHQSGSNDSACLPLLVPAGPHVAAVTPGPEHIIILTTPEPAPACCPTCQLPSTRISGSYGRRLADLPSQGRPVCLRVRLHRLRCRNPDCRQRTFGERLPEVAQPHARRSQRLRDVHSQLGLASRLAISASPTTLLRIVRAEPIREPPSPPVIGIDEWA